MAIAAVLLLSSLGFFAVTAQVQDCSRPVGDNMDLKGNDILLTSFPDGTTVTFACNTGYASAGGSPSVTCTAGSWSPVRLKCERKNCGAVEEVDNGQIHYDPGTEFGDKAVLICNTGYRAVGGGDLICGDQGWMGRLPVCEVIKCESPPVVEYGSFSPNKDIYEYNEVLQYTCKKDYTLDGSRQLHCSDDATFKPEPPRCIKVECGDPEIPFGQWSSGARPPYGYLSTVTLQCNAGYTMTGAATVMCDLNSQWSPGLPQCIRYNCGPVHEVENGQIEYHPGTKFGDKAVLICNPGHMPVGGGELTCGSQGWTGRLPVCEVDNGSGSSPGLVIGILVGVVTLLVIGCIVVYVCHNKYGNVGGLAVCCVCCIKNSKKGKRKHDSLATPQLLAVKTAS